MAQTLRAGPRFIDVTDFISTYANLQGELRIL